MNRPSFTDGSAIPLDRALQALRSLAAHRPVGNLRHADVARAAGLPWQTVRSLLGPREGFAALLDRPADAAVGSDTRSRILEAAARCFSRKGFAQASLDEVAAEAGLTKGAVYWHFESKHDLFFALLEARCAELDRLIPAAAEAARKAGLTGEDRKLGLKTLMVGIIRQVANDPNWPRLFIEFFGQTRDPAVRAHLAQHYRRIYEHVAATVRAGMSADAPPKFDAGDMAVFWIALVDGLMLAWLVNPDVADVEHRIAGIIDILWVGLSARHHPDHPVEPS